MTGYSAVFIRHPIAFTLTRTPCNPGRKPHRPRGVPIRSSMAGEDIAQLYAGKSCKAQERMVLVHRCPAGSKVLATHGICHDLKDRLSSGDPRAGESSDCNWGCVRRDLLRRGMVA